MPPHAVHRFSRLVSKGDDGRAVYGCAHGTDYAGCPETEIRHANQPSPYEQRRQAELLKKGKSRGGPKARREGA